MDSSDNRASQSSCPPLQSPATGSLSRVEMDAASFNASVYNLVRMIPPQKVTSCGHIAKLVGVPKQARRVNERKYSSISFGGVSNVSPVVKHFGQTSTSAPWHRVISTSGIIAAHGNLGSVQRSTLENEGVVVCTGILGESRVEFSRWGWFPDYVQVRPEAEPEDEWGA
ncbi:hypothetical protein F5I97DRAFT_1927038 [Phlebopus sp. FC_14]|nr:hypothetical protein F5I97DRAFT_1927038 [Phlebopus sp. FC_14]